MASERYANTKKSLLLVTLMILMTQVGYLENLNPWTNGEQTLDETDDVMETGGSSFVYANDKVSGGNHHTCAILDNGDVKCWGKDDQGQLGDGGSNTDTNVPSSTAIDLGTGRTAVTLSTGTAHTCAILDNGDVKCWGSDDYGQLGDGGSNTDTNAPSSTAIDLGTGRTAVAMHAGWHFTCAILDNGDVKCWGRDDQGQLGDGGYPNTDTNAPSSTAIDLGTGRTAVALTTGQTHACAILDNGDLKCWGDDWKGQLGDGGSNTDTSAPSSTAIDLGTGRTAVAIAAGSWHTCAILDNGDLKCWGADGDGQLGDGGSNYQGGNPDTNTPSSTPIDLGTGRTAVAVSAGARHTCAILDNGDVKCWGRDNEGQLGDGGSDTSINTPPSTPVDLGTGRTAVAVSAGDYHTCAILDNGEAKCWGSNTYGQLGIGSSTEQGSPVAVSGSNTWDTTTTVSSGSGSSNTLTASVEGADLITGQVMTDITFEYIGPTTYGNYSTWEATNINSPAMSMPGANMQTLVGDTIYFDASDQNTGTELWAYDTSNHSEWRVDDINSGSGQSFPGVLMELLVGDTLYFSADDGTTGRELWAYNTSNSSVPWQVADINSGGGHSDPGKHLSMVIDDVLYFSADDGSAGPELYAYNTSNGSDPWLVDDLFSGGTGSAPGHFMQVLVDDTIYFDARGGNSNGIELWAYNTSDHSTQRVTDINSGTGHSRPGAFFSTLVDDTIYFSATDGTTGVELWAYDTSNHSTWRVADINSGSQDSKPGEHLNLLVGDTIYFSADDGSTGVELWAHDTSNDSTWRVADINSGSQDSKPGEYLNLLVGDTIYFSADDGSTDVELWAHDTSNHSTWLVDDICSVGSCNLASGYGRPDGSAPGYNMQVLVGDTFYFDAFTLSTGAELWAHDTSNDSTWNVAETTSGTGSGISAVSFSMLQIAVGDTLYFSAQDGSNSMELWAHRGAEFTPPPANVIGASSCSSSPSLPLGLSIDSSTCTISGTPTSPSTNQTYTITAVMNGVTYQTSVWLSSSYLELTPSIEGADLSVGVPMDDITFQFNTSAASGSAASLAFDNNKLGVGNGQSCAILANGSLMCWGSDQFGALGTGAGSSHQQSPVWVNVGSGLTAESLAYGQMYGCVVLSNGSLKCWGYNANGQLGDGTTANKDAPVAISLGTGRTAEAVAVHNAHTCAILDDGSVKCWGDDTYGELGNGAGVTHSSSPPSTSVDLGTDRTAVSIDIGGDHSCAILDDGSLKCWGGDSNGQLGNGATTTADQHSPVSVDLGTDRTAIAVSAGWQHTCAILDNGSLKCWGSDGDGQLGNGATTTVDQHSPVSVDLGTDRTAVAVVAGRFNTCAILDDGSLKCWGDDSQGQLGNGASTTVDQHSPVSVDLGTGRTAVAVNIFQTLHTCAILDDASMKCWGFDGTGGLGNGPGSTTQHSPSLVTGSYTWDNTNISSGGGSNSGTYNGNGTAWMVKDIYSGSSGSTPNYLTPIGNTLYFQANDGTNGVELWKSDGTASGTVMVKDIYSGSSGSTPLYFTAVGNTLYFRAHDGTNGIELWKSDGTTSGTVMVKDIYSGSSGSSPSHLAVVGNTLYFSANDGPNGTELWKSDGTASGTVMVKDIYSGSSGSSPNHLTAVGNTLYFQANDGTNGVELWKSDGTTSGTVLVKDIRSGGHSASPVQLTPIGNTLFFRAHDGTNGAELWKSDGTTSGTVMAKDIASGGAGGFPSVLTAAGNTLYFSATDGNTNGIELWKSDGTTSGTVMVKDIYSGSGSGSPQYLTAVGNTVYFRANDGTNGTELWKSDGTTSGTVMVQDINSGGNAGPRQSVLMGNTLYFQANQPAYGGELWALDPANITGLSGGSGSGGGMTDVANAMSCVATPSLPAGLNIDSSTCTISGTPTAEAVNATYEINATISGITYLASIWLSSAYSELIPSAEGADLYLDVPMTDITFHYNASTATTTAIGNVNGQITTYGNGSTWKVADLHSGSGANGPGSTPMNKISYLIGDVHYFNAQSTTNGWELWAHNPSNGTLWEVTDISTASWGSYAGQYLDILVGDTLYFSANDDSSSEQLWAHDTSNDSTWKVIAAESNSGATIRSSANAFIAIDGDVFYFSGSLGNGYELIAYNTSNGTLWEAADIAGSTSSNPEGITASSHATIGSPILSDDVFVFTATSDYSNKELWAYNISNATAWEAYDINPGILNGGNPQYIAHIDDVVYFVGNCDDYCNPDIGKELFAYNATNQSGWLVADIVPGSGSGNPGDLMPDGNAPMVIDGTFYFDADHATHGWELWAHTPANQTTWLAADINSGYGDSKPGWYSDGLGVIDGRLYFDADDGINGRELWVYDPSNASSWRLTDIAPGSGSGVVCCAEAYIGDTFYVSGDDGINGKELWAYDSSNGSSWLVENINTWSTADSNPGDLILIGNTIYFRATDGSTGAEMYAYQPAEITSSGSSGTCSISPGLPTGLNIDSSTCTISGTPTVESVNQTYTVTAVISGVTYQGSVWLSASTFGTITSAVEGAALNLGEAMTPITLNYTSQAGTATVANGSGNETRWTIAEETSSGSPYHVVEACNSGSQQQTIGIETMLPDWLEYGSCSGLIEDTIYFRGRSNASSASVPYSLWAFRPANDSVWAVTPHLTFATTTYIQIVDERIYFIAMPQSNYIAGSTDLYVHDTTNGSTWMAYDVANNVAEWSVFGDHLLLHEWGGSSGNLLNLHTFSTNETWEVPGKWVHQCNCGGYKFEFGQFHKAGNQILFQSEGYYIDSNINNGNAVETGSELWVYDLSNNTTFGFDVSPITSSFASEKSTFPHFFHTIGTRTYFRACDTGTTWANGNRCGVSASSIKHALWVYESSNTSIWRVTPAGEQMQGHWVGDQYWDLKANPDNSNLIGLRIFDSTNHSIWWETNGISLPSNNNAYYNTAGSNYPMVHVWAGTRAYFTAKTSGNLHNSYYQTHLWAYEASNNSAWELLDGANVPGTSGNPSNFCNSQTGTKEHVVIGTEIFFLTYHNDACGGWLSMEPYGEVTFSIPPPTTWETEPSLPAGMSISGGTISGTPSVYALNQTYTIYANQSGYSTTHELYFSVDTDNAHTVVENQTIDPIGFHPPFNNGTTCWSVSPALPGNLSIDSSTGEITGSVNGTLTNTTYTVTANHGCTGSGTGGSSGNGTTYVPLSPAQMTQTNPRVGDNFMLEHDGIIYYDALLNPAYSDSQYPIGVFAFNPANGTQWMITNQSFLVSGTSTSADADFGYNLALFVGDILFFSAWDSIMAYDTSNQSTWIAITGTPHFMGSSMEMAVGDRLYADLATGGIGIYDTSNHSYWTVGSGVTISNHMAIRVGDNIYFGAEDSGGTYGDELYAFNTINESIWMVSDIHNGADDSNPGDGISIAVGDTIYFSAISTLNQFSPSFTPPDQLWAHNTSNGTTYLASDLNHVGDNMRSTHHNINWATQKQPPLIGDTFYFDAEGNSTSPYSSQYCGPNSHSELYAYNTANQTAWCVHDAGGVSSGGSAVNGEAADTMLLNLGDIVFFAADATDYSGVSNPCTSTLHAHNVSNGTTWVVEYLGTIAGNNNGCLGDVGQGFTGFTTSDTLYFVARAGTSGSATSTGLELWGYNIVNHTAWMVNDTCPGWCNGVANTEFHWVDANGVLYIPVRESNGIGAQSLGIFNPALPIANSSSSGGSGSGSSGSGGSTGTGATETFTFNLQSLADYDGDGLPNDLPSDYDAAEGPTPGLVADTDDDADGLLDTVETNTGTYVDSSDTGTDPLNPDTDGDGICDGPNAVPGVCVAGPDTNSGATVVDTPIVLLNNSDVDEIAPFYPVTGATYGLSPDLPTSMQFDASNGSIWGTPDMVMANTTYTMWANLTDGTSTSWTFFLEVLEDLDGDGMPDVLPGDYNATNDPIRTPGLEEDLDDDGDGYNDTAETDTGLYLDGNNTGTDPRDPDTDDDGICDGPGTVLGVCTAGPDLTPFGPPATVVAVNNTMIPSVPPYYAGSGLTYEYTPDLPAGLTIDPMNGYLMGIPTETTGNITYTVYANDTNGNTYSWDFTIEVLEDSDGDGSPDTLPADYDGDNDSIRAPPGLTEDLDDDNDGMSDEDEILNGTEPLNPDTDGDGFCDGINAVAGVCFAGPDPYPNDANLPLDTDGDGLPDDDSAWTGPPYADEDDDNDGYPDVSEDACGSDSLDANSIPDDMDGDTICDGDDDDIDGDGIENVNETGDLGVPPGSSPTNPDTDGDGICDGPESPVTSNCTAGPDMFPLDPSAWEDTDGDGYPNELFPPSNSTPPLEEDLDDDNDGWSDIDEVNCGSDPVNASDMPVDENGDGICDVLDLDWDDDGIPNANETDTGTYNDSSDTGTDPWNPDTDGDGICDGPFAVSNDTDMICVAGPDPFPHDPTLPLDTDGDGMPNELPEDYIGNLVEDTDDDNDGYSDVSEVNCDSNPLDATSTPTNDLDGDGLCDAEDPDVDGDGLSNETEMAEGSLTSYMNADTDGDGVCDGPSAPALPAGLCVAGPDAFPDDPAAWLDTDGDGDPDELVDGITTDLVLDMDDDNDGWEDVDELACGTNTKDDMSTPFDGDDDDICDVLDTQTLGYTINGNASEMFEAYVNQSDFVLMPNLTGMEPGLWTIEPALPAGLSFSGTARSGETGIITGIPTEASPMTNYTVTADNGRVNISFTFGLGVLNDTDGDRLPDEPSLTGLETDLDDDNDGHLDEIEVKCGSDPVDQTSVPNVDKDGNCIEGKYAEDDSDDGNGFLLCLMPFCLILLLALLLFALLFKDKVILMGPEPENTTSDPAFLSGEGTKADPFVLKPVKALKAGSTVEAKETISIVNMSPEIRVNLLDLAESTNDKRFRMYEVDGTSEEPGFNLEADEEGRLRLRFVFDDSDDPTYPGGTYDGLLKLGKASVYLSWTVEVKEDKRKMNKIRKEQEAAEKAEKEAKEAEEKAKAEAEAKEAEEKAKAEAEAKAAEEKAAKEAEKKAKAEEKAAAAALAKKEKEEAAAKKKEEAAAKKAKEAEEKAAKEAEEAEAKAKAEAEAKAAEEKAAKEAEKKAKAEEKAAAAALAKKEKEEAAAKKKEEAAAKKAKAAEEKAAKEAEKKAKAEEKAAAAAAAKKAKEEEEAKKKAEAEAKAAKEAEEKAKAEAAAKKKAEKKPAATKEAKKQEELQRVKKRAKSIDFKVIGEASSSELKSEVKKGATTLEVANAKEFAESGSAEINDSKGSNIIAWTGKDGNTLTGVSGVTRVFAAKAVLMVKDDLQVIKGIGPFIEEKLNALGITTYRQLANMTAKLETQVNEAIEFFPGRVKRDQWVNQAKILLGMDVKLDEKALKQAEELERIAQKAEGIDFAVLGVASASEADDLQKIKGIGPFIAEKLNALGIYKFSQLANMTSEIEEEVNVAIEFFPGRVKRDEWAKQAKEFAKD